MGEPPDTCFSRLETWFASMCNGDWEHTYGITLETVDNPGWLFTVEITDTPLWAGRLPRYLNAQAIQIGFTAPLLMPFSAAVAASAIWSESSRSSLIGRRCPNPLLKHDEALKHSALDADSAQSDPSTRDHRKQYQLRSRASRWSLALLEPLQRP